MLVPGSVNVSKYTSPMDPMGMEFHVDLLFVCLICMLIVLSWKGFGFRDCCLGAFFKSSCNSGKKKLEKCGLTVVPFFDNWATSHGNCVIAT